MNPFLKFRALIIITSLLSCNIIVCAQQLSGYTYNPSFSVDQNIIINKNQFNGYTDHWQDDYKKWIRYGNLFKISTPEIANSIIQNKIDIAEDMNLPGLWMQEGFMNGLLSAKYTILKDPSPNELEQSLLQGNILVFIDSAYTFGKTLSGQLSNDSAWGEKIKSHQYGSPDIKKIRAFYLEKGNSKIFIVASEDKITGHKLEDLITDGSGIFQTYDLHKGWFGAETHLKNVKCGPGHPLEVIGRGMNEGDDWFTFAGLMDYKIKDELVEWIKKTGINIVTDVGVDSIYGCTDYDGVQPQDKGTRDSWIKYAHSKGGYAFRPVYAPEQDAYHFDGYDAGIGNKEQVDNENVPFVSSAGSLENDELTSMVLFTRKGETFTRERMWESILQRRGVAVLGGGKMMGPALYRNALELLLLDRVFLEEYFGDHINLQAATEGYTLQVVISNTYTHAVTGNLNIKLPPELEADGPLPATIILPPGSSQVIQVKIHPTAAGMNKTNPIAISYTWNKKTKSTLAILDLPPAISVHRLLYGHAPIVKYPVTVHNFSSASSFPVQVQVFQKDKQDKAVFTATKLNTASQGSYQELLFDLKIPAGNYEVQVSALGQSARSQLGVGKNEGHSYAYALDLNGDGVNEYRMENDSVQVTLLATGARIIEYIIKSRKDNIFFKLWPQKPEDDKRAFRKYEFYPYGGFEDFLGQASMETHRVYDARIVKKEGDYVQVVMTTDYFGNRLEKTFTLYGNSPLLEIRYALNFQNPEASVIGPQPILKLGAQHGTEDEFMAPDKDGMLTVRMRPDQYFGRIIYLKEGWNAGYDTKEDISFVGAYPVTQPLFLHMWMNHPVNPGSHYYYAEFQPWVPIIKKSTMYFSYYIWGAGGPWKNALEELRKRNLITER